MKAKIIFFFFTAILMLSGLFGCDTEPVPEKKPVIRPVVTFEVQDFVAGRVRTFPGTARAELKTYLSFRVGGEVTKLTIDVGDRVKAGQEIARLDDADYRIRVQQHEAELARVEAALNEAKASFDRTRQLYEKHERNAGGAQINCKPIGHFVSVKIDEGSQNHGDYGTDSEHNRHVNTVHEGGVV